MKKRKGNLLQRMMAVLLSAVMAAGMTAGALPVKVLAYSEVTAFSAGWSGSGTESDPYLIQSVSDLQALAEEVNGGTTYGGKFFRLTSNLDLSGINWTPIGNSSHAFEGTFDGGFHTVYNLTAQTSRRYCGLFGKLKNAAVKNLGIENADIQSDSADAAALAGNAQGGSISRCYVTGTVKGRGGVSGILGSTHSSSYPTEIDNCYARVKLVRDGSGGTSDFAGISGWNEATSVKITNSYSACIGEVRPIAGWSDGSEVRNSQFVSTYFDSTLSPDFSSSSGRTDLGRTSDQLKAQSTFSGWDFNTIWKIEAGRNGGYPYLQGFTPGLGGAPSSVSITVKDTGNNPVTDADVVLKGDNGEIPLSHEGEGVYSGTVTTNNATYEVYVNGTKVGQVTQSGNTAAVTGVTVPSASHSHSYSYQASGNIITETCGCGHSATATVTADNGTYTGSPVTNAEVVYSDGWNASRDLDITYADNINAGQASASITVSGKTAAAYFTIEKAEPELTVEPVSGKTYGDADFKIIYSKNGESPVTFSSGNENAVTVGADGTVHIIGAGTADIRVSMAESANYNSAGRTVEVVVSKKTVTVRPDGNSKTYGAPDPVLGYTSDGLLHGDSLYGELSREPGEDAGSYAYTLGTLGIAGGNYNVELAEDAPGFEIKAKKLTENMVSFDTADNSYAYTGESIAPGVTVADGKTLTLGSDYELSGETEAADCGEHRLRVVGKGNYTGEVEASWYIKDTTRPDEAIIEAFEKEKTRGYEKAKAKVSETDSDEVKKLAEKAAEKIAAMQYDEGMSPEENQAEIDRILEQLDKGLEALRAAEAADEKIITGFITGKQDVTYVRVVVKLIAGDGSVYNADILNDSMPYQYSISAPSGEYNLIVEAETDEGIHDTIATLIDLAENMEMDLNQLEGQKNSEVILKEEAPTVLVGGLDQIAEIAGEAEDVVKAVFTVDARTEDTADGAEKIKSTAAGKKLQYMDFKLTLNVNGVPQADIGDSNTQLLKIIVPFVKGDKRDITVYRYHNDSVDVLTESRRENGEGIEVGADSITIYAMKFSTYAIGYTEPKKEDVPQTGGGTQDSDNIETGKEQGENTPDVDFGASKDDLISAVLTPEEQSLAAAGTDVKITLVIDNVDAFAAQSDKQAAADKADGYKVGQYFDINLYKLIGTADADRTKVTQTNEKLRLVLTIPDSLKNTDSGKTRSYAVVRVHNGAAELLEDMDSDEATITIETDLFFTYAIVYKDTANTGDNGQDNNEPGTGDTAPVQIFATLAMVAGLSYVCLLFKERKRGMTEEEKNELIAALIAWGRKGGKLRRLAAIAVIFVVLCYYHSIGKKVSMDWEAI